jgi:phosphate transport system permease protein
VFGEVGGAGIECHAGIHRSSGDRLFGVEPMTTSTISGPPFASPMDADAPRKLGAKSLRSDRRFRGAVRASGILVLAIMSLIGVFLAYRALQALKVAKWSFLTTSQWEPDAHHFGIAAILIGTILIGLVAIVVAVPMAVGTALFISEYAPRRLKRTLIGLVDLMAAVPSVVYGLWGFFFLQPVLLVHGVNGNGLPRFLATYFGWIPIFHVTGANPKDPLQTPTVYTSSTFVAGLVVSLMVAPIVCSIMREVFSQAPVGEREGALALGATRWGMIRSVVLPYGRGGMIGGTMLGLGRALGETIGVYLIISPVFAIQPHILQNGANSVSALIALRYGEASKFATSALMAAGLVLFLLTLMVNFGAASIVARSRSGAVSE